MFLEFLYNPKLSLILSLCSPSSIILSWSLCTFSSCQHRLEDSLNSCGDKKSSPGVKISGAGVSTTAITKQFQLPASWQISKWCLDSSVPQSNNSTRRRAQPPCWPSCLFSSTTTIENPVLSNVLLWLYFYIWNWTTYQTLLIETLYYHITFNSTLFQPKIAFAFDPLYQMFSLSYPKWHLIS